MKASMSFRNLDMKNLIMKASCKILNQKAPTYEFKGYFFLPKDLLPFFFFKIYTPII